ncbi:MAG TPA: PIN domain-containing protein [archaeon]|nr:PIN domain-containing protein [archaeon]
MEEKPIIFIDSNYWIYLFDQTTLEHKYIKDHFEKVYDSAKLAVNVVVMVEVMHYLIKRLGSSLAKEKWNLFSSMDFVIGNLEYNDLDSVFLELSNYTHTGIGGRDATILAFLKSNNITKFCTHDKSFKKIPDLEMIDPVPNKH